MALHFSDALDKIDRGGARVGGLSDIAYDRRSHRYASTVDNHLDDPARSWFYRDLGQPRIVGDPLVLRRLDGTPYDGTTADDEGLAILPDGDFLVSSETEPSIRIFGRDGVQRANLPVPAHGRWSLRRQLGYRVQPGNRMAEVQSYGRRGLVVLEAAFAPATGNTVDLYAVAGLRRGTDVSTVANLGNEPAGVLAKRLVADVTACPTLGATAKQPQTNPCWTTTRA